MNTTLKTPTGFSAAHPLFPPEQAFLWLPAHPGPECPFCSYNVPRFGDSLSPSEQEDNASISSLSPPFPISPQTFVAWDYSVSPPRAYHPVPTRKMLTSDEMADLAREVIQLSGVGSESHLNPMQVLKADHKCFVIAVLAEMGLLAHLELEGRLTG